MKQAYYVEPDKIGRKPFYLLRSVLQEEGLTAICKVVIKDREALAALDPFAETMLLTTLHWPDEVRATSELDLPDEEYDFKPAELAMARQLVSAMTAEFDPSQYKDEYRDALMQVIESKIEGHEVKTPEPAEDTGKLVDLMAALEASVNAAKAARAGEKPVSVAEAKKAREGKAAEKPAARKRADAATRTRPRPRAPRRSGSARPPDAATAAMPLEQYQPQARLRPKTPEPAGASTRARGHGPLRHPAPPRDPAPLRLPPRDRGRPRQLGGAEGPDPRSGRPPDGGPRRGPPDRVLRLRGRDPGEAVRRRRRDRLGLGHLGARGGDARIRRRRSTTAS